jgi:hypothetical protein
MNHFCPTTGCVAHSGGSSIHTGGPSVALAAFINSITHVDSEGRRYYRHSTHNPWLRLRSADSFRQLNRLIDQESRWL